MQDWAPVACQTYGRADGCSNEHWQINGVSANPRNASKRLATPLGCNTCQAGTGAAMPFTSTAPRSRYLKRSPTSRRVAAAITTAPGAAKACNPGGKVGGFADAYGKVVSSLLWAALPGGSRVVSSSAGSGRGEGGRPVASGGKRRYD